MKPLEFSSAAELREHYRALHRRVNATAAERAAEIERKKLAEAEALRAAEAEKKARKAEMAAEAEAIFERLRAEANEVFQRSLRARPNVDTIIARIAAEHGVPVGEIMSSRRSAKVVACRAAAMVAVARARPDYSYPRLGELFGRDHTTIMHAVQKFGGR